MSMILRYFLYDSFPNFGKFHPKNVNCMKCRKKVEFFFSKTRVGTKNSKKSHSSVVEVKRSIWQNVNDISWNWIKSCLWPLNTFEFSNRKKSCYDIWLINSLDTVQSNESRAFNEREIRSAYSTKNDWDRRRE